MYQNWTVLCLSMCVFSACGGDSKPEQEAATHKDVALLLGGGASGVGSCAISSCHGEQGAEANLNLAASTNLRELLVDVPACEAPGLKLVQPFEPEKSWLWIKLTGNINSEQTGDLVPDPSWGQPGTNCGATGFGKRMPRVRPYTLTPDQLARIRSWIEAGAPGPDG